MRENYLRSFLLFGLMIALHACGDNSKFEFPPNVFTIDKVYDVGNLGSASDIRVKLTFNTAVNPKDVNELRLIITKSTVKITLTEASEAKNYFSAASSGEENQTIRLASETMDFEGNSIESNTTYNLYVLAMGTDGAMSLSNAASISLENKPIYAGDYVGKWKDDLGDLEISLTVNEDYTGLLFYTKSLKSCCKGVSDAIFVMVVNGSTIESFNFDQYLKDYPPGTGGHCPAAVSATGKFIDDIRLTLDDFPFSDCDGAGRTVTLFDLTKI